MAGETRRVQAAKQDMAAISSELRWLARNLATLDVVGWSRDHQPESTGPLGRRGRRADEVYLDEFGQGRVRALVAKAVEDLEHCRRLLTADRVALEAVLAGPGADSSLQGSDLGPGELRRLRARQGVRVERAGDLRFGEWEAAPPGVQPKPGWRG